MKKPIIIGTSIFLGAAVLGGLSGCSQSHQPLNGVYYGYYENNKDNNQFVILAFDVHHPGQVAIRQNLDHVKTNSIFPVKYTGNTVTIKTRQRPVLMRISNHDDQLTCPSCDGKRLPKTYLIGRDKGEVFDPNVAAIAFNFIAKDSKHHGAYQP